MSEPHRFRCEIRHILRLHSVSEQRAKNYLRLVEKQRGQAVASVLNGEYLDQWFKGNKGKWGVWIENQHREQPCK